MILPRLRLQRAQRFPLVITYLCFVLIAIATRGLAQSSAPGSFNAGFSEVDLYGNTGSDHNQYQLYPAPAAVNGGTATIVYTDQSSGQQVTVSWDTATLNWKTITLKAGINVVGTWVDGTNQGYPGSMIRTSGTYPGVFTFISSTGINSGYFPNDNRLEAYQGNETSYNANGGPVDLQSITFNTHKYLSATTGYDYQGNILKTYSDASGACWLRYNGAGLWQLGFPGVGTLTYNFDPATVAYVLKDAAPVVPNGLSKINDYSLTVSPAASALPAPIIRSFVWKAAYNDTNHPFNLRTPDWYAGALRWCYSTTGNDFAYGYQDAQTNAFVHLDIAGDGYGESAGITDRFYASLIPGSQPNWYTIGDGFGQGHYGGGSVTAVNGVAYGPVGGEFAPQGPIQQFAYGGSSYAFSGSAVSNNGNWITNYTGGGGRTATAEYSPLTGALVKLIVHPSVSQTAVYVDGASVGRPGAYVLGNNSPAGNHLSSVNGDNYTTSGDMATKVNALVNNNGVFDINGNFLTLGLWSNDANHVGLSLSYDDGVPVTVPASIDFTASRPLSQWTWNAATADNTGTIPMMLLDESNRLSLYPGLDNSAGAPAVPTPTVVLDPTTNGVSRFGGTVRFEQAVRIEPQGDLSMGDFTQDGFASGGNP